MRIWLCVLHVECIKTDPLYIQVSMQNIYYVWNRKWILVVQIFLSPELCLTAWNQFWIRIRIFSAYRVVTCDSVIQGLRPHHFTVTQPLSVISALNPLHDPHYRSLHLQMIFRHYSPQSKQKPRTTSEFLMTTADKVEKAKGNKSHSSELFIVGFGGGSRVEADSGNLFFSSAKLEND